MKPQSLDPRQIRTRERVFLAARTVLRREGIGGATIDAIAAEACVARSTVYRNWTNCEELLGEAFDDVDSGPSVQDSRQPLVDQLSKIVTELARALTESEWGIALPSLVAAIDANPDLAARYSRLSEERRQVVRNILIASIARSELPPDVPVDDFIDALVGPLFYRKLILQRPTTRAWVLRHLQRTLTGFGVSSPTK